MLGLPLETITMLVSTFGSFFAKLLAQRSADQTKLLELAIKKDKAASSLADAAAKRSSPFLRKTIGLIVITIAFGGLLVAPILDIPVSIIQEVPKHSFLWGLIEWGKGVQVITAEGLVFPEWVRHSVMAIIGFVFGTGFSKTR